MKKHYDFSKAKRGAVVPSGNKIRISIRFDPEIIKWFKEQVESEGRSYQTLMNEAMHEHISKKKESLELVLRRVIREELKHH